MKRFFDNKGYILAASIAFVTILIYLPSLQNEFVNWDDHLYVYDNTYIRSLDFIFFKWAFFSFHAANWLPLTWISYAIDYAFWGLNPMGYHLTNVLLHGLNTFLVVVLVTRLISFAEYGMGIAELNPKSKIQNPKSGDGSRSRFILIAATLTGILFGFHPLRVESVAWVTGRKDVLYAFFFLLSIITYTKYVTKIMSFPLVRTQADSPRRIGNLSKERCWTSQHDRWEKDCGQAAMTQLRQRFLNKYYLLSLCFFLLSLLSKPMAITLPVVLLIMDWYPFRRFDVGANSRSPLLSIFIEKIPFFALSMVSAGITITSHRFADALVSLIRTPLSTRILVAFKSLISYLGKMLLPIDLIPFYPYPKEVSLLSFKYLLSVLLVVGITLACIAVSRKQRIWLAVWTYYAMTVFPVLGLFQAGEQAMADRFIYLPSIGPFLIIGLGVTWFFEKLNKQFLSLAVSAVVVISMSYATIKQIGIWKDSFILWNYVIEKEPQKVPLAYNNRGVAYDKIGQYDRAIEDYNSAIALKPVYADAYYNRGLAYDRIGRYDKAIEDFTMTIAFNPKHVEAYHSRGVTYGRMGQYDRAIEDLNSTITLNPDYVKAYSDRGVAYDRIGRYDRAIEDFSSAITLNPDDALAYSNRGLVYSRLAVYEEALKDFTNAIRLNPNSPELYSYRGSIYKVLGRLQEAEMDFIEAERIKPR